MHLLATNIAEVVLLVFGLAFQDDSMHSPSRHHFARSDTLLSLGERVSAFAASRTLDQYAYGWAARVWVGC